MGLHTGSLMAAVILWSVCWFPGNCFWPTYIFLQAKPTSFDMLISEFWDAGWSVLSHGAGFVSSLNAKLTYANCFLASSVCLFTNVGETCLYFADNRGAAKGLSSVSCRFRGRAVNWRTWDCWPAAVRWTSGCTCWASMSPDRWWSSSLHWIHPLLFWASV